MEKKFMNIYEVAEYLSYSVGGIRNLIRLGKIPVKKPNGRLIFVTKEIDNWVLTNGRGKNEMV